MNRVDDWFGIFLSAHQARCPREDWPDDFSEEATDFWGAWRHQFVIKGITEEYATRASLDMAGDPPRWRAEHLPSILKLAAEYRRQQEQPDGPAVDSLDHAKLASKACPDCEGSGFAPRWVHAEIEGKVRTFGGGIAPIGARVLYPCSCPLGKKAALSLIQPGQQRPPLTVDEYPSLRRREAWWGSTAPDGLDNKYRHRPEDWDADNGCPVQHPDECRDLASLKDVTKKAPRSPSAASVERSRSKQAATLPEPASEDERPFIERADIAPAIQDPVVARELAPRPQRPAPTAPTPSEEDIEASGWF